MADSFSTNLLLTIQTVGGNNNTWGTLTNANIEEIDDKFGDVTSISTTGGNTTLSTAQEVVNAIMVSGTLASNAVIIFSGRGGSWVVRNDTTGDYTVTVKVSGQPGVTIPQGGAANVFFDGTDIDYSNPSTGDSAEVTVASATTCDVLGAGSEYVAVSGTTTITSFGTGPNKTRFVRATGAFTITHNATTLILPGGSNITTIAGDTFVVISDASNNARVFSYQRSSYVPSVVPVGSMFDYAGTSAPSLYLLCFGQAVSRTTYAALFAVLGTTYGVGDASTTFNIPDHRGRVSAGKDNMGGSAASRLTTAGGGVDGATLGAVGGTQSVTLVEANLPTHTHSFSATTSGQSADHTHPYGTNNPLNATGGPSASISGGGTAHNTGGTSSDHTHTVSGTTGTGSGSSSAHFNVQPVIVHNKIIFAGA